GEAVLETLLLRQRERFFALGLGQRRDMLGQQWLGLVGQDARRDTGARVFDNPTLFRVRGVFRYPGDLQGSGIGPSGELMQALEPNRIPGSYLIERFVGRIVTGPGAFIPSPADDPFIGRRLGHARLNLLQYLLRRSDPRHIQFEKGLSKIKQM